MSKEVEILSVEELKEKLGVQNLGQVKAENLIQFTRTDLTMLYAAANAHGLSELQKLIENAYVLT